MPMRPNVIMYRSNSAVCTSCSTMENRQRKREREKNQLTWEVSFSILSGHEFCYFTCVYWWWGISCKFPSTLYFSHSIGDLMFSVVFFQYFFPNFFGLQKNTSSKIHVNMMHACLRFSLWTTVKFHVISNAHDTTGMPAEVEDWFEPLGRSTCDVRRCGRLRRLLSRWKYLHSKIGCRRRTWHPCINNTNNTVLLDLMMIS